MNVIRIRAEGRPAPKGSRTQHTTRDGRVFTRAASKYEAPWVQAVTAATQIQMRHCEMPVPPYMIDVEIVVARPKKSSRDWPSQHDLDKLARSTIDGLVKGGALDDDRNVTDLTASKRFTTNGEPAGAIAIVASASPT